MGHILQRREFIYKEDIVIEINWKRDKGTYTSDRGI